MKRALATISLGCCLVACGRSEPLDDARSSAIPDCSPGSPEVIYPLGARIEQGELVSDGTSLYTVAGEPMTDEVTGPRGLLRISKSDRGIDELVPEHSFRGLQAYAGSLLVVSGTELLLVSGLDGSSEVVLPVGYSNARIAVDGERIATLRRTKTKKYELVVLDSLDSAPRVFPVAEPAAPHPSLELQLHGSSAYFMVENALQRISLDTGETETIIPVSTNWSAFAVAEPGVFWMERHDPLEGALFWLPFGDADPTLLATFPSEGTRILVDEGHVYWSTYDGHAMRVGLEGGRVEELTRGSELYPALAQDAHCIFLTSGSQIIRASK